MAIVFSLGGSIFGNKPLLKKYSKYFEKLAKEQQVGVVVGGGKKARNYISEIKKHTNNEAVQHLFGTAATHENAEEFCGMLKNSNRIPALDFGEAFEYSTIHSIIVMGGTVPYLTTDSNAVILAELLEAEKIINLTNVDYLYDKDPKKHKNAKEIKKLTKQEFHDFVLKNDKRRPGEHFVVDFPAAYFLTKTNSSLYIINGKSLAEVKKAVEGKKFKGTVIK